MHKHKCNSALSVKASTTIVSFKTLHLNQSISAVPPIQAQCWTRRLKLSQILSQWREFYVGLILYTKHLCSNFWTKPATEDKCIKNTDPFKSIVGHREDWCSSRTSQAVIITGSLNRIWKNPRSHEIYRAVNEARWSRQQQQLNNWISYMELSVIILSTTPKLLRGNTT